MAAKTETVHKLHELLARTLVDKLQGDPAELTAAELGVIRQFLKDNDITAMAKDDNAIGQLAKSLADLPEFGDDTTIN